MTITLKNSTVLRAGATLRRYRKEPGSVPYLHPCGPNHFLICCSIYAAGGGITQVAVKVASEDFAAIIEMMSSVNPQRVKNLISQALTFDELDALRKAKLDSVPLDEACAMPGGALRTEIMQRFPVLTAGVARALIEEAQEHEAAASAAEKTDA